MIQDTFPEPVQDYLHEMQEAILEDGFLESLIEDYGLAPGRNDELFENLLFEITTFALTNFHENFVPNLNEVEFEMAVTKACVATVLSELQEVGMVEAIIDEGEVKYQLTPEWKK